MTQGTKKVVFCGTFTAGGLKTRIEDGKLRILQEGRNHKFLKEVEHLTFSTRFAREAGQEVVYVTERAVFELRGGRLVLTELAPGIDLERDVLAHMDFVPEIAADLKLMDARIFREEKMNIR